MYVALATHVSNTKLRMIAYCYYNLYSILCNLWQLSLDCVHKCLKEVQMKKGSNSAQLHQRSFTMLGALRDFYHSEGNGIREEDLKTDTYNV